MISDQKLICSIVDSDSVTGQYHQDFFFLQRISDNQRSRIIVMFGIESSMTSVQPTDFCFACTAIFATDSSSQQTYHIHYKNGLTGLKEAISAGCDICAKLWASLTPQQQDAVEANNHNPDQLPENKITYYRIEQDERPEKSDGLEKFYLLYIWPISELSQASTSRPVTSLLKRFKIISSVPLGNKFSAFSYRAQNASEYNGIRPHN